MVWRCFDCSNLESEGISSWSKGQGWHVSFVHRLLRNRAVLGEFQPLRREGSRSISDGAPVPDYYPAIVEVRRGRRPRSDGRPVRRSTGKPIINLFAESVFDGYNGSSMRLIRWNHTQAARGHPITGTIWSVITGGSARAIGA